MGPGRLRGQRQRGNHERENPWHKTFAGSGHAGRAGLFLDSGGALFRRPADHYHRLPVSGGDVHGAVRLCGAGRGDPDGRHQRPAAAAAGGGRTDQRRRRGGAGLRGPGDAGPPEGDPIPPYPDRTVAVRGGGGAGGGGLSATGRPDPPDDPRLPGRSGGGPAGHGGGLRSRAAEPGDEAGLHVFRHGGPVRPDGGAPEPVEQPAGPGGKLCPADHRAAGGALFRRGGRI